MKTNRNSRKRLLTFGLIFTLILSLTGCTLFDSKAKIYSRYVTSLLDINYKNLSKDYITLTGVSQSDAEAVYVANMDYQAHNLMHYYGIKEVDDGTILSEFYYLAQSILSNSKYEVSKVTQDKESGQYVVDVTVYPLDTLESTYDSVVAYIESFNAKVEEGDYNNATEVEYETEFAEGIIDILKSANKNPGYLDPVTIKVPIVASSNSYCIEDEDFLTIDSNILFIRENVGSLTPEGQESEDSENTESAENVEE